MTDDLLLKIAEAIMVHYGQVCMSRELAEMIGDVNARRRDGQPITSAALDLIELGASRHSRLFGVESSATA